MEKITIVLSRQEGAKDFDVNVDADPVLGLNSLTPALLRIFKALGVTNEQAIAGIVK